MRSSSKLDENRRELTETEREVQALSIFVKLSHPTEDLYVCCTSSIFKTLDDNLRIKSC